MTTLKTRPSISGANFRTFAIAERNATSAFFANIVDLIELNEATVQIGDDTLACELQWFYDAPDVDKVRDLRLWKDTSGELIGFGQLIPDRNDEIEGYLFFDVHPTRQGGSLETEILQWSEARMREMGKELTVPTKINTLIRSDKIQRRMLLEERGFTNERCFLTMACSLERSLAAFSLPEGFTLQRLDFRSDRDFQVWVDLYNESFIDHWNHHDLTVDAARFWLDNPHYKPELNLVAVAPDGTLAAFCVGYLNRAENARTGRNEGWIKFLGTRRSFRRLGLGRAILLAAMRQFKELGVEQVKLGVDAQNLTKATQLYQSLGFCPESSWLFYAKQIQLG